jgi:hypothetical protein
LGDGTTTWRPIPVDVSGLTSGVAAIAVGAGHTCALTSGGGTSASLSTGVKCWGANAAGQLGDGATITSAIPITVSGLASGVATVVAGASHTCAALVAAQGGAGKCWGYNFFGQLGDGTTISRAAPVTVNGLTSGVAAVAAGANHSCALLSSGGIKCWGYNAAGQLGDGTTINRLTAVDVIGFGISTFYISGRVMDGGGRPLAGVTIAAGASYLTTTDAGGYYTVSGLPAATYTLTAVKAGYTFAPANRTLSVPPNATGQDFIGTLISPPTATPTPTVTTAPTIIATPTITATPMPTATATATATTPATPTMTPTPSVTPTAEPLHHVNLPLVLR